MPQLDCAAMPRTVLVADHLVMLDLATGKYSVLDQVATLMWQQLLRAPPGDRDIAGLARRFSAATTVVVHGLGGFVTHTSLGCLP